MAALVTPLMLHAADNASPEAKLRESLRNSMLQVRSLQTERDTLQAAKDQVEGEKKELNDKLEAANKQAAADQAAAAKVLSDTRGKLAEAELQGAQLRETLEKWKTAQKQAADLAAQKETARSQLANEKVLLQRRIDDQQMKNAEMYKIAKEILSRYESFGLGTALTAREPFVGATRVKLQTLVQDFADKLADERLKPQAPGGGR